MAYKHQKFISHSSGDWKPDKWVPAWLGSGESPLLHCKLPSFLCQQGVEGSSLGPLFIRALIPFMRAPPSCPNHFPKAPPTHITTLGIRISTYEFGEAGNIQSIALNIRVCSDFSSLSTDFSFFSFCFRIPHSIQLSCLLSLLQTVTVLSFMTLMLLKILARYLIEHLSS